MTEEQLQAQCFQWHWNNYHSERRMLHCNNNNSSDRIEGNKNKAVGVVAGVADMELTIDGGGTVFIEMKLPGKKQSEEQIDFMKKVRERGHIYIVIFSFEDFKNFIKKVYG